LLPMNDVALSMSGNRLPRMIAPIKMAWLTGKLMFFTIINPKSNPRLMWVMNIIETSSEILLAAYHDCLAKEVI
jgi:hypothetical protein